VKGRGIKKMMMAEKEGQRWKPADLLGESPNFSRIFSKSLRIGKRF